MAVRLAAGDLRLAQRLSESRWPPAAPCPLAVTLPLSIHHPTQGRVTTVPAAVRAARAGPAELDTPMLET